MNSASIISAIDQEIAKLTQVRKLLAGSAETVNRGPGRPKAVLAAPKKRTISPEARARIAAAQKKRWAKVKKG